MRLSEISYSEYSRSPREWKLNKLVLGNINLLVGTNATGKTRSLNLIGALSNLLSAQGPGLDEAYWNTEFVDDDYRFHYKLKIKNREVVSEQLLRFSRKSKKILLERGKGGSGKLWGEKSKRLVEFQSPPDQIVALARQDKIQHSYFIPLVDWGKRTFHFHFGRALAYALVVKLEDPTQKPSFDPKETSNVIEVFRRGEEEFGEDFVSDVISDMQRIGYSIEEIGIASPTGLTVSGPPLPGKILNLYVKEKDLRCVTEQISISAGMLAALSTIIQINYRIRAMKPSCLLIDDIGEGLDYERSCELIDLLIEKARKHSVQLIMTSNDRFVMNRVPLENWTVLNRTGSTVIGYNIHNSAKKFEQFRFTGMSNFDLFATDYLFSNSRK